MQIFLQKVFLQKVVVPRSTTSTTMYKTHSTTTLVGEESPSKMLVQDAIKRGIKAETGIIWPFARASACSTPIQARPGRTFSNQVETSLSGQRILSPLIPVGLNLRYCEKATKFEKKSHLMDIT